MKTRSGTIKTTSPLAITLEAHIRETDQGTIETNKELAVRFNVHYMSISKAIKALREANKIKVLGTSKNGIVVRKIKAA